MNSRSEMRRLAVQNPDALIAEIERLRDELATYKKAKTENDDRFQIERDEARAQVERLREALEFYANRDSWELLVSDEPDKHYIVCDLHEGPGVEPGTRARAALKGDGK